MSKRQGSASRRITLNAFIEDWLEDFIQHSKRNTTYVGYKYAYDARVKPFFEGTKICDVKLSDISNWVSWMAETDDYTRSHQYAWTVLKACFTHAERTGVIETTPFRFAVKPQHTSIQPAPFTPEEIERILQEVKTHRLYAAFLLAFESGLRQGELFGLHWNDINFQQLTINIRRQAVEVSGRVYVAPPKTQKGYRVVPITPEATTALRDRRITSVKEGLSHSPIVFPTCRGGYMPRSNFAHRHWKPLLKSLGLPIRGMHSTRHTTATHLLRNGVPVHVTSAMLGHSSSRITLETYAHVIDEDNDTIRTAISKFRRKGYASSFRLP